MRLIYATHASCKLAIVYDFVARFPLSGILARPLTEHVIADLGRAALTGLINKCIRPLLQKDRSHPA